MNEHIVLPQRTRQLLSALTAGGLLVLAFGLAVAPTRVWSNLLVVSYFFLTLALGGATFVALTYISGASWNIAFRRIPEAMATLIPVGGVARAHEKAGLGAPRLHVFRWLDFRCRSRARGAG